MSRTIHIGVVGVRNIGMGHIRRAADVPGCEVVAVADTDAEHRRQAQTEFGIGKGFATAAELFADSAVDAVVLAVPNALHMPLTVQALEAGKHVLVEKPVTRSTAEADAILEARDRTGLTVMVGMNQRFSPENYGLRNAIRAGAIGVFQYGKTFWRCRRVHEGLWGRGDWFFDPETSGGGPLLDLGIHRLDLALFFLGFPKAKSVTGITTSGLGTLEAQKRGKRYFIEDGGIGLIRFDDGSALELEASYFQNDLAPGQGTILYGTKGSLQTAADTPLIADDAEGTTPVDFTPDTEAPTHCVEHFVRVLRGEEELASTVEQARAGVRIVEALYQSAATGREVALG